MATDTLNTSQPLAAWGDRVANISPRLAARYHIGIIHQKLDYSHNYLLLNWAKNPGT